MKQITSNKRPNSLDLVVESARDSTLVPQGNSVAYYYQPSRSPTLDSPATKHQFLVPIILGGASPESSSYHARAACDMPMALLIPIEWKHWFLKNIHVDINGCTPTDIMESTQTSPNLSLVLYTICVSSAHTMGVSTACLYLWQLLLSQICQSSVHFRNDILFRQALPHSSNKPQTFFTGWDGGWEKGKDTKEESL